MNPDLEALIEAVRRWAEFAEEQMPHLTEEDEQLLEAFKNYDG